MSKKFSLNNDMLNGLSKNTEKANDLEVKKNFKIEYIEIDKIIRNKDNFYEITEIDSLAEDIKINGLNHNLVVRAVDNGSYELISGERRFTAMNKLVSEGDKRFTKVPCKIVKVDDIDSEIILIQANAQARELTEKEKLKQVDRLTALYKEKKERGEKVGNIRKVISEDLKLSSTQVGRYDTINKKLIPELKELIDNEKLNITNASEFATLNEEGQKAIYEMLKENISLTKKEAVELKEKMKRIEKEKEQEKEKQIEEIKRKYEVEAKDLQETLESRVLELEQKKEELKDKSEESKRKDRTLTDLTVSVKELENKISVLKSKEEEEYKELEKTINSRYENTLNSLRKENKKEKQEKEELKKMLQQAKLERENLSTIITFKNINEEIQKFTDKLDDISIENCDLLKRECSKIQNNIEYLKQKLALVFEQEIIK